MNYTILLSLLFFTFTLQAELFFTPQMIRSHLKGYTDEEIQLIHKDLDVVRSVCFEGTYNIEPLFYLASAGAPGARKTTILERFVANHPEYQMGVYLDPDPRTLKYMVHTYYARSLTPLLISQSEDYDQVIKNGYKKWRGASNYIVLNLLEEAFGKGCSIIHGTTLTGGHIPNFLAKLKENDFKVILLLCSCPDQLRYDAVNYRNRVVRFYQSSPEDALSKGLLFPQKMEAYFAHADQLYFFWSDSLFAPERLAGIWQKGKLEVLDPDAMKSFIDKYELDRSTLKETGISIPAFEKFILSPGAL